jgi:hypothetical protein
MREKVVKNIGERESYRLSTFQPLKRMILISMDWAFYERKMEVVFPSYNAGKSRSVLPKIFFI